MHQLIVDFLQAAGFVVLGAATLLFVSDLVGHITRKKTDRVIHESDIPPYKVEPTDRLPKDKK